MKKLFYLIVSFFCIQFASAQETTQTTVEDNNVYTSTEVKPEYPGGMDKCREFIAANFRMPQIPQTEKHIGKVLVQFVVEKDGSLTDIKPAGDVRYGMGEEAVRVIQNMQKWKPGLQNGKLVRTRMVLPIYTPSSK